MAYGDAVTRSDAWECRCSPAQIERYRQRISGPLLEAIQYRTLDRNLWA